MNDKTTTDIISTTGINITKYDILPAKVFINGVEVTDTESWNKAISTFSELENKINNLQSKIDKAIEILGQYKHLSSPTEEQANEQEEIVSNAYDILKGDK